jgi:MoaA/NifB/PqqE/SkfB family radical SAM enzyme
MKRISRLALLRMFAPMLGRVPASHLWYLWRRMANEKPHRFGRSVRINTFFPPWPSEAFSRFCRNVAERKRAPYSVYMAVTGRCPCRCGHCSCAGRAAAELSTEQWKDLIAQVGELGACTAGFTGGEPLTRADLEEFIAAAKSAGLATIVFTTGHGLDVARARRLADAGVDCVTIGIESADAATHDAIRGVAGSWECARAAVAACLEAGVYPAVSTIGLRDRIASGELERMYALAGEWGAGELRLLAPVATGGIAGCAASMLSEDERRALYDFHVRHNRERTGPAVASFAYLESDAMFGCGAGFHHLFLDAAGEVCPCDLTPLSLGNATRRPLAEIWREMGALFPRPRCGCLMGQLAGKIAAGASLPLPPEQSRALIGPADADTPLPDGYRRLLR